MAISVIKPPKQPSLSVIKPQTQGSISVTKPQTQTSLSVAKQNTSPIINKAQNQASVVGNLSATPAKQTYIDNKLREFYRDTNSSNLIDKNTGQVISATEFGIGTPNAGKGFKEVSSPTATVAQTESPIKTTTTENIQSTAQTPQNAVNEDVEAYKKAYANYISTLGETPQVANARKAYTDYLASYLAGKNELTGRAVETGNVPLGLLRGQQERLADQAQPELTRLEGAVGMETAAQTAQQAKAKAGVDMAQSMLPSLQSVGGNIVRTNPLTGQTETVYSTPQQLSAGASLVDPTTGKVIAQSEKTSGTPTASIQEYEYYANQEKQEGRTPKSYSQYQIEDANRKVLASTILNSSGLTPSQSSDFLSITSNYQKDALIQAYDKGTGLEAIADQVIKDPKNASNQLKSLYVLVKNLDPDSAVREGEIALANKTNSYLQNFQTAFTRLYNGQVINPDTAVQLAKATKELVSAWGMAANQRQQRYSAQAEGAGVTNAWNKYLSNSPQTPGSTNQTSTSGNLYDNPDVDSLF